MTKPKLSFWQIWNMSFGFLGIQFGFALQNANVSRIFETLGANIDDIPILWIAAPVTGLIVQPIIGHMSDKTWNKLGRRRPYFLIGAIFASIALVVMPNSPALWVAAGMLWIMDASINISMEPFRAFVGDMLPSEQRTKGFAMQSFFIGIGAVVASALPYMMTNWFGVANTAPEGEIPPSVRYSFYLGALAFIASVGWTVLRTKEYSPEELEAFAEEERDEKSDKAEEIKRRQEKQGELAGKKMKLGPIYLILGAVLTFLVYEFDLTKELYVLTVGLGLFGLLQLIGGLLQKKERSEGWLNTILDDLYLMPKTMVQLAFVQFFSWFALFAMWIYTTAGVTSHIYDMKMKEATVSGLLQTVNVIEQQDAVQNQDKFNEIKKELNQYQTELDNGAETVVASMKVVKYFLDESKVDMMGEDVKSKLKYIQKEYNTGADWVGISFAVYNGFAALVAFLLPVIARYTNRRFTHAISLIAGGLGLISIYFIGDPNLILVSMLGVGLAWASILAMPYAILAGALPSHKMGIYMGIFNFFIVLPQILAATILGFVTKSIFGGEAIFSLMLGGASWFLAAGLTFLVKDVDEVNE
jgi:MFS family permease